MDNDLEAFGRNLREVRRNKGLTQEKLAELAGLNPRTVQKIEAGKINILLTTVLRLQRSLGCNIQELFPPMQK